MSTEFSEPFIRRPVGTTLLAIGLFLVGAVAYRFLPVASMPTVDFPTINVTASRPGADPETMAATVAAPLERRLGEIPGVTELTSRSSLGNTPHHHPVRSQPQHRGAARDVQAALNAALTDLPGDLQSRPTFRKSNPAATPIMILALTSKTVPPSALYDAADTVIAQRCRRSKASPRSTSTAPSSRRSACGVNPIALASMGLVHGGRAHRDRQHQRGRAGRRLRRQRARRSPSAPTISSHRAGIRRRSSCAAPTAPWCGFRPSPRSKPGVRNSRSAGWFNGQPSVLLVINKQSTANVIETVDRIHELLPEIKRWISPAIDISVAVRPHPDHPRQRARHAAHAARDHHPGHAGGVRVPAARGGHHRRRRDRAAVACRHLRG